MANLKECKINGADYRDIIFPVGSVYVSTVNTNPATLMGVGTWSQIGSSTISSTTIYYWKRTA